MKDFLLNYWDDILSIVAIIISVASFIQNRSLHNDNKRLTTLPNLDVNILFDKRITGKIVRENNGIDELNIWKSKYSEYYTNHDLYFCETKQALFTVLVKNVGLGVAKNINIREVSLYLKNTNTNYKFNEILFTCSTGETKANKIYSNYSPSEIKKVEITIDYEDILNKTHIFKNTYEPLDEQECEMKLVQSKNVK